MVYGEQTIQLFGEKNWFFLKKALNCFDVPARYGNRMIASAGNRFGRKPGLFVVIGNFIVFPVWRDGEVMLAKIIICILKIVQVRDKIKTVHNSVLEILTQG